MDEKTIEKMVTRSFVVIRKKEPVLLTAVLLFVAGLFWLGLRAALGHFLQPLYAPFMILSLSIAVLPLTLLVSPLALFVLSYRKQEGPVSLLEVCSYTWRPSLSLFIQGVLLICVETLFAIFAVLWSFFEAMPVVGQVVHVFFSWVPPLIALVMALTLVVHCVVACYLGTTLVVHPVHATKESWSDVVKAFSNYWLARLKLYFFGAFPLLLLLVFLGVWQEAAGLTYNEFCASVFRSAIYSCIGAPFFIFLVHMIVEAERYIVWCSRNKS